MYFKCCNSDQPPRVNMLAAEQTLVCVRVQQTFAARRQQCRTMPNNAEQSRTMPNKDWTA